MSRTALAKKKPKALKTLNGQRLMAAGQFKAKCFRIMDEVPEPGKPLVVTKRGKPVIEVLPARPANKEEEGPIFGRLKGIVTIVGDPDDLIKPVFPLEDCDMLK